MRVFALDVLVRVAFAKVVFARGVFTGVVFARVCAHCHVLEIAACGRMTQAAG